MQPSSSTPFEVGHSLTCAMHSPALLKHDALSWKAGMVPQKVPRDTMHASFGAVLGEIHDGSRYQFSTGSFMHVPTVTAVHNDQRIPIQFARNSMQNFVSPSLRQRKLAWTKDKFDVPSHPLSAISCRISSVRLPLDCGMISCWRLSRFPSPGAFASASVTRSLDC
jgi:hypothetical protein